MSKRRLEQGDLQQRRSRAHQYGRSFIDRYALFLGRRPEKVIVFAEDYDLLDRCRLDVPIDRGPSREEYA